MDFEAQQAIQGDLNGSERLLWAGRPAQGVLFRKSDALMIPFSLLWCGFAVNWEFSAASMGADAFFLLFGGVFVVVGLYFVFGRFIYDAMRRKKLTYAITNERVLIRSRTNLQSLNLRTLSDVSVSESASGRGTIMLGPTNPMAMWHQGFSWPGMSQIPTQLEGVENAREVFDILGKAQRDS